MYNFGGKPRKTEYMEAAKLEPWPGGGGGVTPDNGLYGEERFRTPVKAKPQRQTSEGRVSRIISRPGSVKSSVPILKLNEYTHPFGRKNEDKERIHPKGVFSGPRYNMKVLRFY